MCVNMPIAHYRRHHDVIIIILAFVIKFLFLSYQLVIAWDVDGDYQPCSVEVTAGNWYKGFHLNVRATADNLVEQEIMTRTIRFDFTKIVDGAEPEPLMNSTEITVRDESKNWWEDYQGLIRAVKKLYVFLEC